MPDINEGIRERRKIEFPERESARGTDIGQRADALAVKFREMREKRDAEATKKLDAIFKRSK